MIRCKGISRDKQYGRAVSAALCFLLPAAVMLGVYALFGMYPFGEKSVLIMDMSNQYVNFFAGVKDMFSGEASPLFSWGKVLGSGYIAVFTYYLSSPFTLFLLFFKGEMLPFGIMLLTLFKIGLSGLTCGIFLRKAVKLSYKILPLFAVCYGLMAYNVAFSMSVMWLDSVVFLPIVLLGVEKIIGGGKPWLFIAAFAINIASNYYTAFSVAIFSALFFVLRSIEEYKPGEERCLTRKFAVFAVSGVGAAAVNAYLLLPSVASLMQGRATAAFEDGGVGFMPDILAKMFLGSYDSIKGHGLPNIFCGGFIIILFFCYFGLKSVTTRSKIAVSCVGLFIIISFCLPVLNKMWHIFQNPQWFPFRFSFVFSAFIIYIAARVFVKIKEISIWTLAVPICFYVVAFTVLTLCEYGFKYKGYIIIATSVLTLIYVGAVLIARGKYQGAVSVFLVLFAVLEMGSNAYINIVELDREFGYDSFSSYADFENSLTPVIDDIKRGDSDVYRIEKTFNRSRNDAIDLGYSSIEHYSSDYSDNNNKFFKSLGFEQIWFHTGYKGATVATDMVFGVKYLFANNYRGFYNKISQDYTIDNFKDIRGMRGDLIYSVYKNPMSLPIGYTIPSQAQCMIDGDNVFENQNRLLSAITGTDEDFFIQHEGTYITDPRGCTYTFPVEGGRQYYIFTYDSTNLTVDGDEYSNVKGHLDIGYRENDGVLVINQPGSRNKILLYSIDINRLEKAGNALSEGGLTVTEKKAGVLSGTFTATKGQKLLVTVPYDKGWSVKIDGKNVKAEAFAGALLCAPCEEGIHSVIMKYTPPFWNVGVALSGVTALAFAAAFILDKKNGY